MFLIITVLSLFCSYRLCCKNPGYVALTIKGSKAFQGNFSDERDIAISFPILHKFVRANRCA